MHKYCWDKAILLCARNYSEVGVDNHFATVHYIHKFCLFSVPAPPYQSASGVTVGFFVSIPGILSATPFCLR